MSHGHPEKKKLIDWKYIVGITRSKGIKQAETKKNKKKNHSKTRTVKLPQRKRRAISNSAYTHWDICSFRL